MVATFQLLRSEDAADGVRRVGLEQVSLALSHVDRPQPTPDDIHEYRRACKRIRALLRLVRDVDETTYRRENDSFRDAARLVSPLRSTAVMPETVDDLVAVGATDPSTVTVLHEYVMGAATAVHAEILRHRDELVAAMSLAQDRVPAWPLPAGLLPTSLGLETTYARGRRAMAAAYDETTDVAFHRWRKRVKYLQHQTELLSGTAPVVAAAATSLATLSSGLGKHQDLADLAGVVAATPYLFGDPQQQRRLLESIRRRQDTLRAELRPLGEGLYAAQPTDFVAWLTQHWTAWRS